MLDRPDQEKFKLKTGLLFYVNILNILLIFGSKMFENKPAELTLFQEHCLLIEMGGELRVRPGRGESNCNKEKLKTKCDKMHYNTIKGLCSNEVFILQKGDHKRPLLQTYFK